MILGCRSGWRQEACDPLAGHDVDDAVDAMLVGYKLGEDQDCQLVLSDGTSETMIAEIPDPKAVDA